MSAVGIDLLEIERMEKALERRPNLAERLFTEAEREYAADKGRPAQHLAARFCAKEAVAKALAMQAWDPLDVEIITSHPPGPPRVLLHGGVAKRAGELGVTVEVSLTHSKGMAGAVAIANP
jgi:holo-[acyl-carrier protein] synthase